MGVLPAIANDTSRIATHDGKWGHIARHHRARSDDCTSSDPATLKDERALAHPGPVFYHWNVDGRRLVSTHGLTEIVGGAVLLEEHAVRSDNDAIPKPSPVDSASRADARSGGHVQITPVGQKGARPDMDPLSGARYEPPTKEGAQAGRKLASWEARIRKVLRKPVVCQQAERPLHDQILLELESRWLCLWRGEIG